MFSTKLRKQSVYKLHSPLNSLYRSRGRMIKVNLKNGISYTGKLEKADDFMNLMMTNAEEKTDDKTIKYPKAFIKGNNILFIQLMY